MEKFIVAHVNVYLYFQDKIMRLAQPAEGDSGVIKDMKTAIDTSSRYKGEITPFLLRSSALDPRFASLAFLNDDSERYRVYMDLHQVVINFCNLAQVTFLF